MEPRITREQIIQPKIDSKKCESHLELKHSIFEQELNSGSTLPNKEIVYLVGGAGQVYSSVPVAHLKGWKYDVM